MLNETIGSSSSLEMRPQPEEIRAALDHLLRQPEFQGSNRIKKFLTFVVERALEQQFDLLKASAIATHVFDRGEDFDAHANPIVRVEATRLRKVLRAVYDRPNFDEPVEIELPLGSYAPLFRYRPIRHLDDNARAHSRDSGFISTRTEGFACLLPERWTGSATFALGCLVVLSVVHLCSGINGLASDASASAVEPASDLRPLIFIHPFNRREMSPTEHLLQGKLQRKIASKLEAFDTLRLRVVSQAMPGQADFHIRSNYESEPIGPFLNFSRRDNIAIAGHQAALEKHDYSAQDIHEINAELDKAILTFLNAAETDLQFQHRRNRPLPEAISCAARMREFEAVGGEAIKESLWKCMQRAAEGRPDSFLAQARLSALWYDQFVTGKRNREGRDAMQEAFRHAQQSIALAPSRAAGFSAYARILLLTSANDAAALQFARAAFELNPLDPDARAILGAVLIVLGQYHDGATLLRDLMEANPNYPNWIKLYLYAAAVELEDLEEQRRVLAVSDRPDSPFTILGRIALQMTLKNPQAGEEAFQRLSLLDEAMSENLAGVFIRLRLRGPKMQLILHQLGMPR